MFIGRQPELEQLQNAYDSGKFECIIIYGRRRIGKTTLINQFLQDKPNIFYAATESNITDNLAALGSAIQAGRFGDQTIPSSPTYDSFSKASETIFTLAETKRLVWVIDEYPYLAQADPSVSSILQHAIDRHKDTSKLMIILCGSSMSFMERQVLGYKSPLYGRRTGNIQLHPFGFEETRAYTRQLTKEDSAAVYAMTGGVAQYLEWIHPDDDLETMLRQHVLYPGASLFEEPYSLLQQELRKPAEYNSIIRSIATGKSKMSEIASSNQMQTGKLLPYLNNLIDLEIIKKETPFGVNARKQTIYRISDQFFRFWYRYIPPFMNPIQARRNHLVARYIVNDLPRFMGSVFEEISNQWIWGEGYDKLPFPVMETGRWWGTDPASHQQEEIDIVATGLNPEQALLCECKWRNEPTGMGEYRTLVKRGKLLSYTDQHYLLFSKSGFTDELRDAAERDGRLMLVAFEAMCD